MVIIITGLTWPILGSKFRDYVQEGEMMIGRTRITVIAILCLLLTGLTTVAQDEHLVGLYFFDDGSGDEVIDSSGSGNNGEIRGGVKRVDGYFEGGLDFNGMDAFVEIPDSDSLDLTDGLTIAMWIYLRAYSTAGGTGMTKETAYKVGTRNDRKVMIRATTAGNAWGGNVVAGSTDVPLEEWHHIAGTYDAASGDAIVYLDGEEDGRGVFPGELTPNASVVWIGRGQNPYFDGVYDEVAIWSIPLSEDEIRQAMNTLHAVEPAGKLATTWAQIRSK